MKNHHWNPGIALGLVVSLIGPFPELMAAPVMDGPAELPRAYLTETDTFPDVTGYVVKKVCTSGCDYSNLQAALDRVQADGGTVNGEVILLASGATFPGSYLLPKYTMAPGKWVIVRTDVPDSRLPAAGERINPTYSPLLAKIFSTVHGNTIRTAPGANYYWLMGLEIGVSPQQASHSEIIEAGQGIETTLTDLPHHIFVDRCYLHGNPTGDIKRGYQMNGISLALVNSYVSDIHVVGQDTQAAMGWNGPGPFKITNNYLEAAGENVLFGGAQVHIQNVVPSDIEIRNNHIYKPLSWRQGNPGFTKLWSVKNLVEFKNGQRVLIEGNVMENNWLAGQVGFGLLMKANRGGPNNALWNVSKDFTVRYNVLRHCGNGFNIAVTDDTLIDPAARRYSIHDNLLEDISDFWGGSGGGIAFQILNGNSNSPKPAPSDIWIDHNTIFQTGTILNLGDDPNNPMQGMVYRNNLHPYMPFGVKGAGAPIGTASVNMYYTNPVFAGNAFVGKPSMQSSFPSGNFWPASWSEVQFVDMAGGDYQLAPTSPYIAAGTDGKQVGADIAQLIAHTCYSVSGIPSGPCVKIPVGPPSQPIPPSVSQGTPLLTPIVTPNPWRSDRATVASMSFTNLPAGGTLRIFTVSGRLVKRLSTGNGSSTWALDNESGERVGSGIYLYIVEDASGRTKRGKLAIIK